jgi:glycerol-3-phosphate O-acyltransferase
LKVAGQPDADESSMLRLEVDRLRSALATARNALEQAEKIIAAAALQKETDHIGDRWFTPLASAAQKQLVVIRAVLASEEHKP